MQSTHTGHATAAGGSDAACEEACCRLETAIKLHVQGSSLSTKGQLSTQLAEVGIACNC